MATIASLSLGASACGGTELPNIDFVFSGQASRDGHIVYYDAAVVAHCDEQSFGAVDEHPTVYVVTKQPDNEVSGDRVITVEFRPQGPGSDNCDSASKQLYSDPKTLTTMIARVNDSIANASSNGSVSTGEEFEHAIEAAHGAPLP